MSSLSGDDRTAQQEATQQKQKGPEAFLTGDERKDLQRSLSFPEDLPSKFKTWMMDYFAVNIPQIPLSQIVGFQVYKDAVEQAQADIIANQLKVYTATDNTSSSTTSGTYADMGPEVTGLVSGLYVVHFGAAIQADNTFDSYVAVSVNGATPSDDDALVQNGPDGIYRVMSRAVPVTVSTDASVIDMRMRVTGFTGRLQRRWIVAMKYGPLP